MRYSCGMTDYKNIRVTEATHERLTALSNLTGRSMVELLATLSYAGFDELLSLQATRAIAEQPTNERDAALVRGEDGLELRHHDCADGYEIVSDGIAIDQPNRHNYDSTEEYEAEIKRRFECRKCGRPVNDAQETRRVVRKLRKQRQREVAEGQAEQSLDVELLEQRRQEAAEGSAERGG